MKNFIKKYYSILLSFILIYISVKVYNIEDKLYLIRDFDFLSILLSIFLAFTLYFLTGLQYSTLLFSQKIQFNKSDLLLFPIVMNLWSFIIPFQGSLFFSTVFFMKKYKRKVSSSIAISLFMYSLSLSLTGIIGFFFIYSIHRLNFLVFFLLLLLTIFPFLFLYLNKISKRLIQLNLRGYTFKIVLFIDNISTSVMEMLLDRKLIIKLILYKIIQIIVMTFWYFLISETLNFKIDLIVLLLLSLIAELALIIKVTPDNLGITQLISGLFLTYFDFNPESGVIISLIISAISILIVFTVGLIGNYIFMKKYNLLSTKELINEFKLTNN